MADLDIAALRKLLAGSRVDLGYEEWYCPGCGCLATRCECAERFFASADSLLDAAEERDRLRQTVRACVRDYNATRKADESKLGEGGLILAMAELLEAREERDVLLAAVAPLLPDLEMCLRSTAPAFLKALPVSDAQAGRIIKAVRRIREKDATNG